MKPDPQNSRAFGALIARKAKQSEALKLNEAVEEISRLRKKSRKLLDALSKIANTTTDPEALIRLLKLIEEYENEY